LPHHSRASVKRGAGSSIRSAGSHQPEAAKDFGRSSTSAIGSIVALFLENVIAFIEIA
jgi:hypothetical protein